MRRRPAAAILPEAVTSGFLMLVVLLTGLVGGPLAGAAAGLAVVAVSPARSWRFRLRRGGVASIQGAAAGLLGLVPGSGQWHAALIASLAVTAALAIGRATAAEALQGVVAAPVLAVLVVSVERGDGALVAVAVAALLLGLGLVRLSRRRQASELAAERENARTDPLTGAPNRRAFEEALAIEHARVVRGGRAAAVLLLDLDRFKKINDRYGHDTGDEALVQIVERLTSRLRATDLLARWGGEELVVLAPGIDTEGLLRQYAERVRRIVGDEPTLLARTALIVTVSVGATLLDGASPPDRALTRADRALYEAKRRRDAAVVAAPEARPLRTQELRRAS